MPRARGEELAGSPLPLGPDEAEIAGVGGHLIAEALAAGDGHLANSGLRVSAGNGSLAGGDGSLAGGNGNLAGQGDPVGGHGGVAAGNPNLAGGNGSLAGEGNLAGDG